MIQNSDGTFYLQKGERFPFKCPECNCYIEYTEKLLIPNVIKCLNCLYEGDVEEFSEVKYDLSIIN